MDTAEFIKDETRKRCKIVEYDEQTAKKMSALNSELLHLLYDAKKINFSIYVRIENHLIEFIRAEEHSRELLDQIVGALHATDKKIEIMVLRTKRDEFEKLIDSVRNQKIASLVESDPQLDRKIMNLFSTVSNASQLIVRGGITSAVVGQVKNSAAYLVSNLKEGDMAFVTLSRMITHDPTLYDHSASVAMFASVIALNCLPKPLSPKQTELVAQCGLYHDVGKTCIPSAVLNKPGQFTKEEFDVMKMHAEFGEEELERVIRDGARIDPLAARVAGEHHERFNGRGYPRGRQGRFEEDDINGIHLYTRIVTIADVYSALLMKRIYKPAYEPQDAIKIMVKVAQEEYDPDIFRNFLNHVVKSLNAAQEKMHGKDKGRLLYFDEEGQLREQKKLVI